MHICDISGLEALSVGKVAVPIHLPGPDYVPGKNLFPRIIAGTNADYDKYNANSWAEYMVNESKKYPSCSVVASWSAINSGTPKIRYWFGYFFSGYGATPEDFDQFEGAEGAHAYNLVYPPE